MFEYRGLPYIQEIIRFKVISYHHNNRHAGCFEIDKTRELIGRKYYWPSLIKDVKAYVKGYDIYLTLKAVRHKPYGDLQSLLVLTHWWIDLSMDFVTGLLLSAN